ncbi:MAG: hypothetical protein LUO80_01040 [Methylococcaceae bacterium]|nr:hypothetical protein [Methylococcaceae bacterium]
MKFPRFHSLKSLIVIGFAIAVMPLIAGVLYAGRTVEETAVLGRDNHYKVYEQTKAVNLVLQKTSDIERKARLFVLLADPSLRQPYERQSYETARASFRLAIEELQKLSVDNAIILLASELSEKEVLIYHQIIGSEESDSSSLPKLPVEQAFVGLREAASALSRAFEDHVDLEFNQMRQQSETRGQALQAKFAALLGISIAFIFALLVYLERSLRQLDVSIRKLGRGNFEGPVTITGPADFADLGQILEALRTRLMECEKLNHSDQHEVDDKTGTPLVETLENVSQPGDGKLTHGVLEHIDDQNPDTLNIPPES